MLTFLYGHAVNDIRLVDSMVDPIRDGFDVVFSTRPLQDSRLIARDVFTLELFLCASTEFITEIDRADHRSESS